MIYHCCLGLLDGRFDLSFMECGCSVELLHFAERFIIGIFGSFVVAGWFLAQEGCCLAQSARHLPSLEDSCPVDNFYLGLYSSCYSIRSGTHGLRAPADLVHSVTWSATPFCSQTIRCGLTALFHF